MPVRLLVLVLVLLTTSCVLTSPPQNRFLVLPDAGAGVDAGDSGPADAGTEDAGEADSGLPDAGATDAGPCSPESSMATCARLSLACGMADVQDNCGVTVRVDCGGCTFGSCGSDFQCHCTPESDADLCAAAAASCGSVTATDNCGAARTSDCGGCSAGSCVAGDAGPACCVPGVDPYLACWSPSGILQCGSIASSDGCIDVVVNCASCGAGEDCERRSGGGYDHYFCISVEGALCGGTENQEILCGAPGRCSRVAVTDSCGQPATVLCDTCRFGREMCDMDAGACVPFPDAG